MAYIPNLSTASSFTSSDYLIGAQGNNNNAQRFSGAEIAEFVQSYNGSSSLITTYSAPSSSGFSVQIPQTDDNYWLILTPTGTFADGEIVLPLSSLVTDQQTITVNCTQVVTTLVVDGNGATVTGEPATLAANGFFTLRYDAVLLTWFRIS